ncbi:unnamed protein product [Kuraishia capsulata CBS 1993]|uniref:Golgi apyrase n=1 Tax=Kuraishia capsulata CBS 1993 TaxID=1382522 RepID=W6MNM7_9ASCO|nr:uncharacterized protein KUCA_T00002630001 [Kuraishia capsulata CBS 1993]CDK26657.1 unnamed protein product [Kuraishia capsulata CBS 1993]
MIQTDNIDDRYGIVIDSGSSGSRIQIYTWKDPASLQKGSSDDQILNSVPKIIQNESWSYKITPGLSSYADKPSKVWDSHFKHLIKHAEEIIPESHHAQTPIFVQATAGMRLLPEKKREKVLEATCKSIKGHSKFQIEDCASHVQVIDGETEGLYGWIGLNYLKGTLNDYDATKSVVDHSSFGFMDMGGASTQIAFVPSSLEELKKHEDDVYNVYLRNIDGNAQRWSVFVSTWLGFGANEARRRHLKSLISSLPEGISYDLDGDGYNDIIDPCSPKDMKIKQEYGDHKYDITGSGDYEMCLKLLYPLLLKNLPCKDYPCLFNGVHAPPIDFEKDKFIGVSEYWYTANDVFHMGGEYNFMKYNEKLKEFCESPWEDIQANFDKGFYGDQINLPLLRDSCFKASWVVSVLHEGFGLPRIGLDTDYLDESKIKEINKEAEHVPFASANLIDGAELSWTLGKILLYAAGQVPAAGTAHFVGIESSSALPAAASTRFARESDSLFGGMFYLLILVAVIGYAIHAGFVKKLNPAGKFAMSKIADSPTALAIIDDSNRVYQKLKQKTIAFYYSKLAPQESQDVYKGSQESAKMEEGLASSQLKGYMPSVGNLSGNLRTRSSMMNLQQGSEGDDTAHRSHPSSTSLYGNFIQTQRHGSSSSIPSLNRNSSYGNPPSDFMGKKYNQYLAGSNHNVGSSSGSHLDLKTLRKDKTVVD